MAPDVLGAFCEAAEFVRQAVTMMRMPNDVDPVLKA